jgi:hypothetical protein
MRVRIRRFTENGADLLALEVHPSRAGDARLSAQFPRASPVSLAQQFLSTEEGGHSSSSHELLVVLLFSMFGPSWKKTPVLWRRLTPVISI